MGMTIIVRCAMCDLRIAGLLVKTRLSSKFQRGYLPRFQICCWLACCLLGAVCDVRVSLNDSPRAGSGNFFPREIMPISDANPFFQEFEVRFSFRLSVFFVYAFIRIYESETNSFFSLVLQRKKQKPERISPVPWNP